MLSLSSSGQLLGVATTSVVLITSIIAGSLLGHFAPTTGEWLGNLMDYTLLALISLLFFGVRLSALVQLGSSLRFFTIAILANFVLVPLIGYSVASLFLSTHPLFMVGLIIYFMAPCTDWFLSFTRLSGGNITLGTALIPINMTLQLLLYPLYLQIFTQHTVQLQADTIGSTLLHWFLLPLVVAIAAHQLLRLLLKPTWFECVLDKADQATSWVTALLVLQIFAGNISVLMDHYSIFKWALLAVFTFFVLTCLFGKGLSHLFRLSYPEHALLAMTIASRNAPLMLVVTMAALPDQPLVYAALVIGMLVEIPHLTALRRLLLRTRRRFLHRSSAATAIAEV